IRTGRDRIGELRRRDWEFGHRSIRSYPPDLLGNALLREPHGSVRASRDVVRAAVWRGNGELSETSSWCNSPDLIGARFGEPNRVVGAGRDALWKADE